MTAVSAAATYERIRQACCPISGLSPAELERHVQAVAVDAINARIQSRTRFAPRTHTTGEAGSVLGESAGLARRRPA